MVRLDLGTTEDKASHGAKILSALPYKYPPYSSRSWGHPLHRLISYPSKLKPSISHFLVKLFTSPGDVVLDPFSGVGTVPFEACSQGRSGYGVDVNPLAYHATSSKVQVLPSHSVNSAMADFEEYVRNNAESVPLDGVEDELVEYFHPRTLREILAAREFLLVHPEHHLLIACMAHILHGNRPYALSRRSHNIMPWPPKGDFVYKSVIKSLRDKLSRTMKTPLPLEFREGRAWQGNARDLPVEDGSVDCILTSPPFHRNRDFLRMNRIRLWFCGWDYPTQERLKSEFLEHQKDLTPYDRVFEEMRRVLVPAGLVVLHLGVVKSFDMATNLLPHATAQSFEKLGLILEDARTMESHGIRDRGATHTHQFLILRSSASA